MRLGSRITGSLASSSGAGLMRCRPAATTTMRAARRGAAAAASAALAAPPALSHCRRRRRQRSVAAGASPPDGAPQQVAVAESGAAAAAGAGANGGANGGTNADQQQREQRQRDAEQETMSLNVSVISSIDQVSESDWDALANASGELNPFVSWRFLHILEASGSASREEGWAPQHVVARDARSGRLVGAVPLYLKGHSYGEYVFDNSWAQFYQMNGGRYYPKLQSCVPFSPVTGPRLLAAPGALRPAIVKALAETLVAVTDKIGVSSLHVTFANADEWAALGALGLQQRRGIQYHWENDGYKTFDDFLAALKQPKRKSIRQERKAPAKHGLRARRLTGRSGADALTARHWDKFYEFYLNTVDKRWGSAYLTKRFFEMLGSEMADDVLLVVAEDEAGDVVAGALNLIGSHALFGRNWGCVADREFKGLHFELCYYQAIDEAIARALPRVEAGAQGEHKLQRGYLPNYTYSAHYCRDPLLRGAVGRFLEREAAQVDAAWRALALEASPYKEARTAAYVEGKLASFASLSSSGGSLDFE